MIGSRCLWLPAALAVAGCFSLGSSASGAGGGRLTVRVPTGGIVRVDGHECRGSCTVPAPPGRIATLVARRASADFIFSGWGGACLGPASRCYVSVDGNVVVLARFSRLSAEVGLTVGGFGTVHSRPRGIVCGVAFLRCSGAFGSGTRVQLVPVAGRGAVFAGWGGACRGLGSCAVTARYTDVTALFRRAQRTQGGNVHLRVKRYLGYLPISRAQRVQSSFPGISCPPTCDADVPVGTVGRLTARALFDVWRGACVGVVRVCPVALDDETTVTARFRVAVHTLPVTSGVGVSVTISGRGRVVGQGARIDCRVPDGTIQGCRTFTDQTKITLLAIPARGSRFDRWTGDCAAHRKAAGRSCLLRLFDAVSVNAVFRR